MAGTHFPKFIAFLITVALHFSTLATPVTQWLWHHVTRPSQSQTRKYTDIGQVFLRPKVHGRLSLCDDSPAALHTRSKRQNQACICLCPAFPASACSITRNQQSTPWAIHSVPPILPPASQPSSSIIFVQSAQFCPVSHNLEHLD